MNNKSICTGKDWTKDLSASNHMTHHNLPLSQTDVLLEEMFGVVVKEIQSVRDYVTSGKYVTTRLLSQYVFMLLN